MIMERSVAFWGKCRAFNDGEKKQRICMGLAMACFAVEMIIDAIFEMPEVFLNGNKLLF